MQFRKGQKVFALTAKTRPWCKEGVCTNMIAHHVLFMEGYAGKH
jgi:hypothetical protein